MRIYIVLLSAVVVTIAAPGSQDAPSSRDAHPPEASPLPAPPDFSHLPSAIWDPPRRHVFWDRPHSTIPSWFPPNLTFIQKLYYTIISHFGSSVAAGVGMLFGPLGSFVSAFTQPYISTYTSRLTNDVVARSLDTDLPILDNTLEASRPSAVVTEETALAEEIDLHTDGSRDNDRMFNMIF